MFDKFSQPIRGLWLTDFDGTIKPELAPVSPADLRALADLKKRGWFRAVATGRSLFSFARAWQPGLEFDALIFSSGVGLCSWGPLGPGPLISARVFTPREARAAVGAALSLGLGFFAYQAPPDNHHFYYHRPRRAPLGFARRLEIFPVQNQAWSAGLFEGRRPPVLSQVMIMAPNEDIERVEADFRRLAPGLSLLRSSSPFGDGCIWLEIYPPGVSKGRAAAALAGRLGLPPSRTVAMGNDYNDRDLLDWAGRAFISRQAPAELRSLYQTLPPAGQDSLARAAELVFDGRNKAEAR